MDGLLNIRFVVCALYLTSMVAYIRLIRRSGGTPKKEGWLFVAALATHFVELLARGAEAGVAGGAPFTGLSGFLSVFAFLVGGIYLFLERRYAVYTLGAFYLPIIFVLQLTAAALKTPMAAIPPLKTGHLFILHVVPSAVAYAAFTVSAVAAAAFLLLDRQLRKKQFGLLMRGLPNLDLVEAVNTAGVKIGLLLLLIGALVGVVMGYREWGTDYRWEIKNFVTFAIIAIYAVQLLLRRYGGFHGRRSVTISLIGFVVIVGGFTIINHYFSELHSAV